MERSLQRTEDIANFLARQYGAVCTYHGDQFQSWLLDGFEYTIHYGDRCEIREHV